MLPLVPVLTKYAAHKAAITAARELTMSSYGRSLGAVFADMKGSVGIKDVYVGAGAAFLGELALNAALKATATAGQPDFLTSALGPTATPVVKPLLAGAVAGGLLFALRHKKNPAAARGNLAGAMAYGIGQGTRMAVKNYVLPQIQAASPSAGAYFSLDGVPAMLGSPYFVPQYGGVPRSLAGVPRSLSAASMVQNVARQPARVFNGAVR